MIVFSVRPIINYNLSSSTVSQESSDIYLFVGIPRGAIFAEANRMLALSGRVIPVLINSSLPTGYEKSWARSSILSTAIPYGSIRLSESEQRHQ